VWAIVAAEAGLAIAESFPQWKFSRIVERYLIAAGGDASRIVLNPSFFIGTGLTIVGGAIRWNCYRVMGQMFTYEVTVLKEHKLVTTGPYSYTRLAFTVLHLDAAH